jgi:cytochrome c biogenesis protein CcmG, thiol:disulfide interchange protein DsbE
MSVKAAARHLLGAALLLSFWDANAAATLDLDSLRGRVVYLDFWASWCAPCRQSFPWMQAMKDAHEREGLTVVAVNLDRSQEDADRFLAKFKPNFDVRFDPQGSVAERFKIHGMPTSVIIDRHGVQRFTHVGFRPVDQAAYEDQLRQVLTEK